MSGIVIKTINGEFTGELDNGSIPDTVWLSLPKKFYINMLASMIYFEFPLECPIEGELVTKLKKGDIAYWPKANALCFFFGPTPLSGDDGQPVAPYPVIVIGRLTGDYAGLEDAGDRQRIILERAH
ncbi:MAG: AfsR family transcriptional regulator [Candidatus Methanomethylophilaceae archaeon]|nr:AfsR family transcriptional regulator [Candidatus Methanomethylophilaceae archaeon]